MFNSCRRTWNQQRATATETDRVDLIPQSSFSVLPYSLFICSQGFRYQTTGDLVLLQWRRLERWKLNTFILQHHWRWPAKHLPPWWRHIINRMYQEKPRKVGDISEQQSKTYTFRSESFSSSCKVVCRYVIRWNVKSADDKSLPLTKLYNMQMMLWESWKPWSCISMRFLIFELTFCYQVVKFLFPDSHGTSQASSGIKFE